MTTQKVTQDITSEYRAIELSWSFLQQSYDDVSLAKVRLAFNGTLPKDPIKTLHT